MPSCAAFGCTNRPGRKTPGVTFHRFPKDEKLRQAWIIAVRRKNWTPSSSAVLCSEHFSEDRMDRTSLSSVRLREHAIPNIFKGFPPYWVQKDCFELWKKRIPRKDREFTMNNAVCELHFPPECIKRFETTLLKDGTVHTIPRGKPALKDGVVPSIFPRGPGPFWEQNNSKRGTVSAARKTDSKRKDEGFAAKDNETSSSKDISTTPIIIKNSVRSVSQSEISVENNPSVVMIKNSSDFHDVVSDLNGVPTGRASSPIIFENTDMTVSDNLSHLSEFMNRPVTVPNHVSNSSDLTLKNPSLIPIENSNRPSTNPQSCDTVDIGNSSPEKVYVLNFNADNSDVTDPSVKEDVPSTFKEIAVLTIYPNVEQFLQRTNQNAVSQNSNEYFSGEGDSLTLPIEVKTTKDFCFDELRENIEKIEKPNHWWGVTCHPGFVVCVKWDKDFSAERKVIINSNLDIKIFLKDKEIEPIKETPTSIEDVSAILKKVNCYDICAGASSDMHDCLVILPPLPASNYAGRRRILCETCQMYRRKLTNKNWYYNNKAPKVQKENWNQKFKNESRKNLRLQKKVKHLKRLLEVEKTCAAAALEFIS